MVMIRTHAKGCTPLTANFFAKHTFARELLPCCFMESFRWIFYNKDEEMFSKTLEDFISEIGYYDALLKEDDGSERIENVKALFQDLRSFLKEFPTATFDEYLQKSYTGYLLLLWLVCYTRSI